MALSDNHIMDEVEGVVQDMLTEIEKCSNLLESETTEIGGTDEKSNIYKKKTKERKNKKYKLVLSDDETVKINIDDISHDADQAEEDFIKFTANELLHYSGPFSSHAKFKSPMEEYEHNKTKFKVCIKCSQNLSLNNYNGNTSGKDPFDKHGYRLKRGECSDCTKKVGRGKNIAIKISKDVGISHKAPSGTECEICKKTNNIVFDHHHSKEAFRGWLCNGCNRSIGMLGENIEMLVKVINYMNKIDNKKMYFDEEDGQLKIVN